MTLPEHWVSADSATSLANIFQQRVRLTPGAVAYRDRDPRTGEWQDQTWADMQARIARWRAGLAAQDLAPGSRVAILLPNSSEWVAIDQAALSLELVVVGLFPDDTAPTNARLLENSGASVLIVEQLQAWQLIESALSLPALECVLVCEALRKPVPTRVRSVADWLPDQGQVTTPEIDAQALAALVYTSGTSGQARGAMLTHANLLWNATACAQAVVVSAPESLLSFLPLAHGFERVVGYYRSIITGATTAFCRQKRLLHKDLAAVRPTALLGVPEVYERYHRELHRQLGERSVLVRRLVQFTMNLGWSVFQRDQGQDRRHLRHLLWPLLRATIAARCLQPLGGRLDTAVTGAAALSPPVARTMIGLGVHLLQGYGLTEAGPVVSVNRRADNDPQSVGLLLEGVETRIGAGNELMLRSPGVMQGYWRDEAATAEAIDNTGWLRTGDKISRLEQQRLYLTGRLKEVIVIPPAKKHRLSRWSSC